MNRIADDGRLPVNFCSVCRHEDFAAGYCTCLPGELLKRGDITQEEAYVMIGVEPPEPGGFTLPLGARRSSAVRLRLLNAARASWYRWQHGTSCPHVEVTPWLMHDADARRIRWCRACGYTELRR